MKPYKYRLGEATGIELEYMIVDAETLDVLPIADEVLHAVSGNYNGEVELGAIGWSNELVLHVLELKTNGPVRTLAGLATEFTRHVRRINELLTPRARLMPSAMHPWMNPWTEMRLWPHDSNEIYAAFDRIFDCRGHGWANLQSMHVNLSFGDDQEFGRLHAAVRLILPILPALAASSPICDGKPSGEMDTRLARYRQNSRRIPSVAGHVVPEAVFTRADYEREIFERIYRDLAPHDDAGLLRFEWANARGAIARFDRGAIEIRVLDVQECPLADLAIASLVTAVVAKLWRGELCAYDEQKSWDERVLAQFLGATAKDAERALISDAAYLAAFGLDRPRATAQELWRHLYGQVRADISEEYLAALEVIVERGPLARRILDGGPMRQVYRQLCDCLAAGTMFIG